MGTASGVGSATGKTCAEGDAAGSGLIVAVGAAVEAVDARGAGAVDGDGVGRGVSDDLGAGVARTGAGGGEMIVGAGAGAGWLCDWPGRTTGFCPSTGPGATGVLGALVGSGRVQVSEDCANAAVPANPDAASAVSESAATVAMREN